MAKSTQKVSVKFDELTIKGLVIETESAQEMALIVGGLPLGALLGENGATRQLPVGDGPKADAPGTTPKKRRGSPR